MAPSESAAAWRLGSFEVLPAARQLRRAGQAVPIGGRAFDLLVALAEARGQPLGKDDLLARVWPGVVVEENNLTVQVSALRKLLGSEVVVTVPGRGYQLGVPVEALGASPTALPDKPSIAVLPFANSGEGADDAFCDGVTEDVITELARFRSLFVISRNSSFSYKGAVVDARRAARELGVRYVLEGSVRRAGERVRVTAQLVDASTGAQAWSEKYDGVMQDIFALQEALTRSIVSSIAPQIDLSERARAHRVAPANLTAYELALRAWALLRTPEPGDGAERRVRACALAEQALALDPNSTLAVRTIAWARISDIWLERTEANVRAAQDAVALTGRVIAADNGDHFAYFLRGLLLVMLHRYDAGLLDLRRAHELNPNDAAPMAYLGYAEAICGNARAGLPLARAALALSPRDPQRYLLLSQLGWCCFVAGDDAAAAAYALQAVSDAPWFPGAWITLAISRTAMGDLAGAREAVAQVRAISPALLEQRLAGEWIGSDAAYRERADALLRKAAGS